jgi:hypothetical protein
MSTIRILQRINNFKEVVVFFTLILILCILKLNGQSDVNHKSHQHNNKMIDSSKQDRVKAENMNGTIKDTMRKHKNYPHVIKDTSTKH